MRCPNCGREFSDQPAICPYCGTNCADPENDESKDYKYCIHCGKEITRESMFCAYCGQKQPESIPIADLSSGKGEISDMAQEDNGDSEGIESEEEVKEEVKEETKEEVKDPPTSEIPSEEQDSSSAQSASLAQEIKQLFSEVINAEGKSRNDSICPFCGESFCQPMQKTTTEIKQKNYGWGGGCCGMLLLGPFGLLCGLCGASSKTKITSELWWTCTKCGKQHIALADAINKWDSMMDTLLMNSVIFAAIFAVLRYIDIGILTAIAVIGPFVFPVASLYGFHEELSEELGAPIVEYLSPDQKKSCLWKTIGAIAILLVGSFFGLRLLESIAA